MSMEQQKDTQHEIESVSLAEDAAESRSAYQKRKREEVKQQKRRKRKTVMAVISAIVILAGVLCGALISRTIDTPHDAVVIASANAQYVKYTVSDTLDKLMNKLPWSQQEKPLVIPPADGDESPVEKPGEDSDKELKEEPDKGSNEELKEESNTSPQVPNEEPPAENTAGVESTENTESAESTENIESTESTEDTTVTAPVTTDNPFGIDPSKPMVALTFDDGPSQYTWPIVASLYAHNARATFFLVGERVATHQAAIEYTQANHNEVASHSFSHANLATCTEEEILSQIQKVDSVLQKQHNYTPTLFRVPYGERNEAVLEIMRQQGKPVIGWSVDPRDWESQDKDAIVSHVLSHVKDGDIILMHDLYQSTADAVAELVPALQAKGYQLVTVSELLQYKGIEATPGTYYYASWKWV